MNPKYQVTIAWSQEDECYLVYLPDFADEIMQPVSHGNTYQEGTNLILLEPDGKHIGLMVDSFGDFLVTS